MTDSGARDDCAFSSLRFVMLTAPQTPEADPDADFGEGFLEKKQGEQKGCDSRLGGTQGDHWSLDLRSTPKRAALRASQGFRASRETERPDIIHL